MRYLKFEPHENPAYCKHCGWLKVYHDEGSGWTCCKPTHANEPIEIDVIALIYERFGKRRFRNPPAVQTGMR